MKYCKLFCMFGAMLLYLCCAPTYTISQQELVSDSLAELAVEYMAGGVTNVKNMRDIAVLPVTTSISGLTAIERLPAGSVWADTTLMLPTRTVIENTYALSQLADPTYVLGSFFIVDVSTNAAGLIDAEAFLEYDFSLNPQEDTDNGVQVLIYHTHGTESYIDSKPGETADTVIGAGQYLAQLLMKAGYRVYHDTTTYDFVNGKDNRNYSYSTALPALEQFLSKHPETEVIIDLHRDSGPKRVTTINGKQTAQIMLFNGLSRNINGPISHLPNENLTANLAFSFQTNLLGRSLYPGLMYRIYLKNYRYNMHLRPRNLLVELGTQNNTVEEAYNAITLFAEILDCMLRGTVDNSFN